MQSQLSHCPACSAQFKLSAALGLEAKVRCWHCGKVFTPNLPQAEADSGRSPTLVQETAVITQLPADRSPAPESAAAQGDQTTDAGGTVSYQPPAPGAETVDYAETHPPLPELPSPRRAKTGPRPQIPGYEIQEELGRGGMGVVYQAWQISLKRSVALKMILAGDNADEGLLHRFRTEAEAVAHLQHPNIVQIYEIGEHQGQPYFSLEFVAGGNLNHKLKQGPLSHSAAARLTEILARAIQHAHQRNVIHRDLKPANILLMEDGTPKITDFGLAKRLENADMAQTRTGSVMGTPSYMAPEQAEGNAHAIGPAGRCLCPGSDPVRTADRPPALPGRIADADFASSHS